MSETALSFAILALLAYLFLLLFLPKRYLREKDERFSYFSHFPHELVEGSFRGAKPYLKEGGHWLLSTLVSAAAVLALAYLSTEVGGSISLIALAVLSAASFLVSGVFEVLLAFHSDLIESRRHLLFYLIYAGSTAIGAVTSGITVLQFYFASTTGLLFASVFAGALFFLTILVMLPLINPKAGEGLKMEKKEDPTGDYLYVRPKFNPLAAGEWLTLLSRLLSVSVLAGAAVYLSCGIPLLLD